MLLHGYERCGSAPGNVSQIKQELEQRCTIQSAEGMPSSDKFILINFRFPAYCSLSMKILCPNLQSLVSFVNFDTVSEAE